MAHQAFVEAARGAGICNQSASECWRSVRLMPRLKRARKASPLAGLPALHLSTYPLVLAMSYRRASRRRDYSQRRNRRRPSGRIMAKHKILRAVQFGVTRKTRFQKRFALVRDAIFELPITPAAAIRELF